MSGRVDKGGALASSGAVQGMRLVRVVDFSAPLSLSDADRPSYVRRFVTLFVSQGQGHRGGTGRVEHARNAQGEHLALKLLSLPHRRDGETEDDYERRVRASHAAFEREYECHILLSGLKGFPRLYGRGTVDGVPCIVMEWVEGITLDRVRRQLVVDGGGRVSPLVAARLGRDLFDLVARMGYVEGGFVHRDISPRNVMVRTSRLSLEQQVDEGVFDLYLIDFGSSAESEPRSTSFTSENAVFRGATADFAPPEMLSDDIPGLAELRKSPAIDVYAAASVVYQLACGQAPYDLHAVGEDGAPVSPYRAKMAAPAPAAVMAHARADELLEALAREPEVAVAVQHAQDKLSAPMVVSEAAEALSFVDEQLGIVLGDCLARGQSERPDAAAVRDALSSFSIHYADNVERSFCVRWCRACPAGSPRRRLTLPIPRWPMCVWRARASRRRRWRGLRFRPPCLPTGRRRRLMRLVLPGQAAFLGLWLLLRRCSPRWWGCRCASAARAPRRAFCAARRALRLRSRRCGRCFPTYVSRRWPSSTCFPWPWLPPWRRAGASWWPISR